MASATSPESTGSIPRPSSRSTRNTPLGSSPAVVPVKVFRRRRDPHALPLEIAGHFGEAPENRRRAFAEELIVVAVEVAQQPNQHFQPRMNFPVSIRSDVAMSASSAGIFVWLTLMPMPDDRIVHAVRLRVHFGQDAAKISGRAPAGRSASECPGAASSSSAAASRAARPATSVE